MTPNPLYLGHPPFVFDGPSILQKWWGYHMVHISPNTTYIYAHCLFRLLFLSIISTAYHMLPGSRAARLLLNWLFWLKPVHITMFSGTRRQIHSTKRSTARSCCCPVKRLSLSLSLSLSHTLSMLETRLTHIFVIPIDISSCCTSVLPGEYCITFMVCSGCPVLRIVWPLRGGYISVNTA